MASRSAQATRMINLATIPTVYLHRDFVDFRKSINGLSIIVEDSLKLSPFSQALFVFCNKKRDKLKILYWDDTEFCLWYKRLEKAKFKWPRRHQDQVVHLSEEQLDWLLRGLDITQIKPHQALHFSTIN